MKRPNVPGQRTQLAKVRPIEPAKPAAQAASARLGRLAAYDAREKRQQARLQRQEIRRFKKRNPTKIVAVSLASVSLAALVGLVLATMYTPMLAIQKIEVVGTSRVKTATVLNAVKSLIGTPLTMVSEPLIQQRLAGFPLIESFTTVSLPPHTLQIDIVERQPIGIVNVGGTDFLYDPAGIQVEPAGNTNKFPRVLINGDPHNNPNYRAAIDVLLAMPVQIFPNIASIQATSKDDVRIRLRGVANQQILWGDQSQSVLKSKVLAALIANTKSNQSLTFDVSSPTTPTVRYGNF